MVVTIRAQFLRPWQNTTGGVHADAGWSIITVTLSNNTDPFGTTAWQWSHGRWWLIRRGQPPTQKAVAR